MRLAMLLPVLACAACSRVTNDMADQPRYNPAGASEFFADRQATRPPVPGSVAHASGDVAAISSGRAGVANDAVRPEVDATLVARGAERYAIYCQPCHGADGDGHGAVVQRGFPAPASFASPALQAAGDERLHDAIRDGVGVMYPFVDRVSARDAWAIVAYVRMLQRQPHRQAAVAEVQR